MSAIERIDQIREGISIGHSLTGGRISFEQMLIDAPLGGPRLEIASDPLALEARRIGLDAMQEALGLDDGTSGDRTDGTAVIDDASASGEATESIVPSTDADDLDAGEWVGRLPERGQAWADEIASAAQRHGLEPELLAAMIWSESAFDPGAVSSAGAIGLTQLMPATAASLGVDPHDAAQNLDGGARYLSEQLRRFGTFELGLAAYNAGPTRVANAGGVPAIAETQAYVQVVLDRYVRLRGNS